MIFKLHFGNVHHRHATVLMVYCLFIITFGMRGNYVYITAKNDVLNKLDRAGFRSDLFVMSASEDCALLHHCRLNRDDSRGCRGSIGEAQGILS